MSANDVQIISIAGINYMKQDAYKKVRKYLWHGTIGLFVLIVFLYTLLILVINFNGITIGNLTYYDKDVTYKEKIWGGYAHNETYELTRCVFLRKTHVQPQEIVLVPPRRVGEQLGGMLWSAPSSVEQYNSTSDEWPDIIGVLDSGTRIRVVKFGERGAWLWGRSLYVLAEITSGPYTGYTVDINDLSVLERPVGNPYPLKPDPRLLKLLKDKT